MKPVFRRLIETVERRDRRTADKQADKDAVCRVIDWLWSSKYRTAEIDFDDDERRVKLWDGRRCVEASGFDYDGSREEWSLAEVCDYVLKEVAKDE